MGFLAAVRHYPGAVFWSFMMSLSVIMIGYDTSLIASFFAYPTFKRKYGEWYPKLNDYEISGPWMIGLSNAISVGELIGLAINGYALERFGHRRVMIVSLAVLCGFIAVMVFAPTITVLCVGQVLMGIPWGVFTVMGGAYSSEVCPVALRGYLTSYTALCWAIGQLIGAGVLVGLVDMPSNWSFRIPLALQWAWPIPLAMLAFFASESPWWLVRKGRVAEAQQSLERLSRVEPDLIRGQIALIQRTDEYEKTIHSKSSYFECFRGSNLRRTEIACITMIAQGWCGERFAFNPTYFFSSAGLSPESTYKMNLGSTGISCIGNVVTWFLMRCFGRRTLLLSGLSGLSLCLLVIGVLACFDGTELLWAQAGLCLVWIAIYALTVGPQVYSVTSEVSATRLRAPTMSIARSAYTVINVVNKVIEPRLINPTWGNLKGKTAFFWLGTNTVILVWAIFRLPELKGKTYHELDVLFEEKVPAWRFARTEVDVANNTTKGTESNPKEQPVVD
ncbi:Maltose permease MAL31 [Pseudocercospora fuligena]|uniref:Maltose permease MAL31 n=1 Tax=Pseudocercospora fuligena TaxID=685502 RepID=A0A8H6VTK7_9PEZI|nr:Maltose permease MAL31 [Pseudocercospora fuligena]